MSILGELQAFELDTEVVLYILDASPRGGAVYRFHEGKNELKGNVIWNGDEYSALPLEVTGYEMSGTSFARPKMKLANVAGVFSTIVRNYMDLVGCKVTRIRTHRKYLDAVNFVGGNPTANPTEKFPDDIFYVVRKTQENKLYIEFELGSF